MLEHANDDRTLDDRIDEIAVGAVALTAILAIVIVLARLVLWALAGLTREVPPRSWKEALLLGALPARTRGA
jgi:hypothetical protein